jgi:hypothetical protein
VEQEHFDWYKTQKEAKQKGEKKLKSEWPSSKRAPGLSLIEEAFSKIKAYIHHHCDYYRSTMGYSIIFEMYEIVEIITPLDALGYYEHAGCF